MAYGYLFRLSSFIVPTSLRSNIQPNRFGVADRVVVNHPVEARSRAYQARLCKCSTSWIEEAVWKLVATVLNDKPGDGDVRQPAFVGCKDAASDRELDFIVGAEVRAEAGPNRNTVGEPFETVALGSAAQ